MGILLAFSPGSREQGIRMEGDDLEALLAELESEEACSQALGLGQPGCHAALGAGGAGSGGLRDAIRRSDRALSPAVGSPGHRGIVAAKREHPGRNMEHGAAPQPDAASSRHDAADAAPAARDPGAAREPTWLRERERQIMREGWRQSQLDLHLSALSCVGDITGQVGDLGSPPSSPGRQPASPFLRKLELDSAKRQVDVKTARVHREQRQIRSEVPAGDERGHGGTALCLAPSTGYMQTADSVPMRPNYRQIGKERRTQFNRERYEQSLPPLQRYGRRAATRLYSWLFPTARCSAPTSPLVSSPCASPQRCRGIEENIQDSQATSLSAAPGMRWAASGKACCSATDSAEGLTLELERMITDMSVMSGSSQATILIVLKQKQRVWTSGWEVRAGKGDTNERSEKTVRCLILGRANQARGCELAPGHLHRPQWAQTSRTRGAAMHWCVVRAVWSVGRMRGLQCQS